MMKGKFKKALSVFLTLCICICGVPFASSANAAETKTKAPKAAVGSGYTLILRPNGTVWASGYNEHGELGIGNNTNQTTFTQCIDSSGKPITNVVDIAAGFYHSILLKGDGTLWACGLNDSGQLGNGNTTNQNKFVKVASGVQLPSDNSNYNTIACGESHTAIIKSGNKLYTCGLNNYGQLGLSLSQLDGAISTSNFTENTSVSNIVSVACGGKHTAIIDSSGYLYTCGGDIYDKGMFHNIKTPSSVSAVSCANEFTAVISNGTLYKSSSSSFGSVKFSQIETNVSSVFCYGESISILKTDKSLYAMGANNYGQLGLGSNDRSITSFQKVNLSNVASVSVGPAAGNSVAVTTDGSFYGAGYTGAGQLGTGTVSGTISDMYQTSYKKLTANLPINATIKVRDNTFQNFLSSISFGYFFQKSATVSISATEGSNKTTISNSNIKYYLSPTEISETAISAVSSWQNYNGNFSINASQKQKVYAKIMNSWGDVKYISSSGFVVYNPVEVKYSSVPEFVKTQSKNIDIPLNLNSNTITSVTKGGADIGSSNYTVGSSGITIKNAYLKTLPSDQTSTFVINYNPQGEAWTSTSKGDKPSTEFKINVINEKPSSATINVGGNNFTSFVTQPNSNYFFNGQTTVSISAREQSGTAIANSGIAYYIADGAKTLNELKSISSWTQYSNPFTISDKGQKIVYVKVTNSYEGVNYFSSDGLVIYNPINVTDTKPQDFVQTQSKNVDIALNLNGNTITSITNDGTALGSSDYKVNGSTLTIENAYLKNLTEAKLTTFTINYNPSGATWTSGKSKGDEPTAQFQINVIAAKPINGTINVGGNEFESFVEQPSFKYFFKDNVEVSISATGENGTVIPNSGIEYYISEEAKTLEQLKALTSWVPYTEPIQISATNKKIVYAKITDSYEGVKYISSDGIIVYTEPKVTKDDESKYFAKTKDEDTKINVDLNGSEVADILLNGVSIQSDNYKIEGSTVTLSRDYLKTLNSNEDYTFTIVYNTLGQTWDDDSQGSKPTSTFKLRVVDSLLTSTNANDPGNSVDNKVVGTGNFESAVNVTIDWGSLEYSYNATWDANTQSWTNPTWKSEKGADKITIENHSSQGCDLLLNFTPDDEYKPDDSHSTIVGTFLTTSGNTDTEVPGSKLNLERSASGTVYLNLDGINDKKFSESELTNQTFGVVTITIQDQ